MFPIPFIQSLKATLGEDRAESLLRALDTEPTVSIRVNPLKPYRCEGEKTFSRYGYFLPSRPSFTADPLFHGGAYYVQEASSMAIEKVLELGLPFGGRVLDLCAAPGGKSTHLLSLLKDNHPSFLVSNEVIGARSTILSENIAKWGAVNVVVTNNDPSDFSVLPNFFDVVLVDAPCSGEGMFRKDVNAREEWSENNVKLCASRQRRIVSDIWGSLREGGVFIYSTCTFNRQENEENIEWISEKLGAQLKFSERFYPGDEMCGEGFFIAILQKNGESKPSSLPRFRESAPFRGETDFVREGYKLFLKGDLLKAYPEDVYKEMLFVESRLRTIRAGVAVATIKGNTLIPEEDLALSEALRRGAFPEVEVNREDALKFLSKEPLFFDNSPLGYLLLTYSGIPLGFVKNLGKRSNNLWNLNWRIKNYKKS